MSKLLRYFRPGQVYFITCVTHNREKILVDYADVLFAQIKRYKEELKYNLIAWSILPDHFHMIIDPKENDLSFLIRSIKLAFSYKYRQELGLYRHKTWQRRFWDHIIRDQEDMNRHIEYIHSNPVKHCLVSHPHEWKYSSFRRYCDDGLYTSDWNGEEISEVTGDFGE